VFLAGAKTSHISQHLILPEVKDPGLEGIKPLFIVNFELPSYSPPNPLWGKKQENGPGFNMVIYFKLTDQGINNMLNPTTNSHRLIKRFLKSEHQDPIRDRFKAIPRLSNAADMQLKAATRKLVSSYNSTPFMTRPQHTFYKGPNYLEVSIDVHVYCYTARFALDSFLPIMKDCVIDLAFVVEAVTDDELPEQVLGSVRCSRIDPTKSDDIQTVAKAQEARHQKQ